MPRNRSTTERQLRPRRFARTGFTLVEALVSISLLAMAGAALLLATDLVLDSATDAADDKIARGIANQVIDEILGLPYVEKGEVASQSWWQLGPETDEWSWPVLRSNFDDADDYRTYTGYPPVDEFGIELGQGDGAGGQRHPNFQLRSDYFDNWYLQTITWHANESDLSQNLYSGSSVSDFRAIVVNVWRRETDGTWKKLAAVRRVYGYVPPTS